MSPVSIVAFVAALLLVGCAKATPQPDLAPLGEGLKAIGICLVVTAVVRALTLLVLAGDKHPKGEPPRRRTDERGGDE
jgi:hypothetical protein